MSGLGDPQHYYSSRPGVRSRRRLVNLRLSDLSADLLTDRGVFSYRRIDPGTKLLLERGPRPPASRGDGGSPTLLDLGCGYGPIALALARRSPASEIWAVDVNVRALELTELNTRSYSERVHVAAPEEVPAEVRFDAVYCNPPVRIGKDALQQLLAAWFKKLRPGGFGSLSVHKNLGGSSLERWLVEQGWNVRRYARQAGYRVLKVNAPIDPCTSTDGSSPLQPEVGP